MLTMKAHASAPRLLVFLHAAVKQRAFQSNLQASLQTLTVTAVGRINDLDRAIQEGQDALLTSPMVLRARGLKPQLLGYRQGRADESYALVSVGTPIDPARAASLGTLDILGREGTAAFVHRLLGGNAAVERVTKVEDLLSLLQMQRVNAVLLPSRLYPELRAMSRLALVQKELPSRVELPALASVGPQGAQVVAALKALGARLARSLGVDEWR